MVYALKSIFLFNYPIWVCILTPFVQMSERSFYNAKIVKKAKTGRRRPGIGEKIRDPFLSELYFRKSQNRQMNIQQVWQKMS